MSALELPVSTDPGIVWRVGYEPDPWQWTPWEFASDQGRFNGRWDDQDAKFRTLYTSESLLGCLLELLAGMRPNDVACAELADIFDDAGTADMYPDPERGAVGMGWLSGRLYGSAHQSGVYAEVTHSAALAFLVDAGVFARLGIPSYDVDASLLKDATKRDVTRTVARFLYNQRDTGGLNPAVDGIAFRSRLGDDIRMWAIFERSAAVVSEQLSTPTPQPASPKTTMPFAMPSASSAFTGGSSALRRAACPQQSARPLPHCVAWHTENLWATPHPPEHLAYVDSGRLSS